MDVTLKAALIAAIVSVVLGLVNMVLTIHRNKQDGITAYRMQWVKELQEEYAKILSWSFLSQDSTGKHIFRTIDELQNSVYKVSLMLNLRDEYDKEILETTFAYLEKVQDLYREYYIGEKLKEYQEKAETEEKKLSFEELMENNSERGSDLLEDITNLKQILHKQIRIYLKAEWTRVKAESTILKVQYLGYYHPFKGFSSKKAIEKFESEYKDIESVQFLL